jgi:hypothetical protein
MLPSPEKTCEDALIRSDVKLRPGAGRNALLRELRLLRSIHPASRRQLTTTELGKG